MAAADFVMVKGVAFLESDSTVHRFQAAGVNKSGSVHRRLVTVYNLGPSEVFFAVDNSTVPTVKTQADGKGVFPVNVPVPLPLDNDEFWHKTASGTSNLLILNDLQMHGGA